MTRHYLKDELYQLIATDSSLFDFIQNYALDGIWYWDLKNRENEWMSESFWRTLGYEPSEKKHLASEWQNIIEPSSLNLALKNFSQHEQDPKHPYDQVVKYRHKHGHFVWIRCRGIIIKDEHGEPHRMLGSHIDITGLKRFEQQYKRNLQELDKSYALTKQSLIESEQIFEMLPDAMLKVDQDGYILKSNVQATRLLGYEKVELESMNISTLLPDTAKSVHFKFMKQYFDEGGARKMGFDRGILNIVAKSGAILEVEITLNLVTTPYGPCALTNIRDVSDRESLVRKLQRQLAEIQSLQNESLLDPLTKIYNKRFFEEALERAYKDAGRYNKTFSILFIDIDDFKSINDNHGHKAGDRVILALVNIVKGGMRHGDIFSRNGGDEFTIILPNTDSDSAIALAERILFEISSLKLKSKKEGKIAPTVSIGIASYDTNLKVKQDILKKADKALYEAKKKGKNQYYVKR